MKKLFTIFLHIYLFTSIAATVLGLLATNPESVKADTVSSNGNMYLNSTKNIINTDANNTENDSNTSMATKTSESSISTSAAENNNTNNNTLDNNSANTEPSTVTTRLKISNSPITLEEDETKKTPLLLLI